MLKSVNKLQNVEACLHFPASKRPLTEVGMHLRSNQVAYIIRITIGAKKGIFFRQNYFQVLLREYMKMEDTVYEVHPSALCPEERITHSRVTQFKVGTYTRVTR